MPQNFLRPISEDRATPSSAAEIWPYFGTPGLPSFTPPRIARRRFHRIDRERCNLRYPNRGAWTVQGLSSMRRAPGERTAGRGAQGDIAARAHVTRTCGRRWRLQDSIVLTLLSTKSCVPVAFLTA